MKKVFVGKRGPEPMNIWPSVADCVRAVNIHNVSFERHLTSDASQ